ncbi:DnaD domain protein [Bacillus sp. Cr_A10]|uniref:DnaD domain protein n=1 Tax=Bacillus sp. Cr_A10 TaxID=3033993 RepID=UPI0023DCD400|nr:DnaD domain protein [Bacillus sp. Cr_A10]MDF2066465.1 DnaD domain protein [Bacillus sp. Cr_A10]
MTKGKKRDKKMHRITYKESYKEVKEMTIEEWNAKLEEKNKAKTGMIKDKRRWKKVQGKVIHGTTPEERFQEIHGMTIEEWHEEQFKTKMGMTSSDWYIEQVKSSSPIDYFKLQNGTITEEDVKLVKDLQELGLNDDVINVLLSYVVAVSNFGLIHSLINEMGEYWIEENILTVEKAIVFVREEHKKYKESSEK